MDMDFWAARVQSAKHLSALQASRLNCRSDHHLNMDDFEGDEDARAYFPCPFCYIEIELRVLCSHLQKEHCFDLKNAVCPLCAANLGKDAIGHFTAQHSHSIKRRRKSHKSGFWSNSPAMIGKDFRELNSFFGSSSISGRGNVPDIAPDPLLSPFLCNVPLSDPKSNQEDECAGDAASTNYDAKSTIPVGSGVLQEQDCEERKQKAAFCQELILSTIF